jgi:molecular chaperone GrpE
MTEEQAVGVTGNGSAPADPKDDGEILDGAVDGAGEEAEGPLATAEAEVELDELAAAIAARDEYLALAQRTQADFENYRKRVARDAASAQERGVVKLARELLPSLDSLDRALAHAEEADPRLVEGLLLVQRELLGAFERVGIESYGQAGEQFDPEQHEAVAQQPCEGREPGEIAEVYQSGYRLSGGLIRPARVLVAG